MLIEKGGRVIHGAEFMIEEFDENKTYKLTPKTILYIQKISKIFTASVKENSTISVLADVFRLYSQAMDVRFPHNTFLGLWQVAEKIALSESVGGKTEEVCKRLAWHGIRLKLLGSGTRNTLDDFAVKRNNIVHKGFQDITDEDVNILKFICDLTIRWLLHVRKELPTIQHLNEFYRFRTTNDTHMKTITATMRYIAKNRVNSLNA